MAVWRDRYNAHRRGHGVSHELRAGRYSSGRPVVAVSSRTSWSESWPVTGSLRSRSNFSIAARVSGPRTPVGLTGP